MDNTGKRVAQPVKSLTHAIVGGCGDALFV